MTYGNLPSTVRSAWPHLDPGQKRHKISIQQQSQTTQDASGQPTGAWPAILNCWAKIDTIQTKEQFQDGFVSQVIHLISIDWPKRTPITTDMRVVVHPYLGNKASVYEIQSIDNIEKRDLVMCLVCLEIDNEKVGS
jgi:SPP1 family predicted phage head-tail adaptor